MTQTIDVQTAKAQWSSLLDRVALGEEFVIAVDGKPVARLSTIAPARRSLGFVNGTVPDSFFDPLPDEELKAWEGGDSDEDVTALPGARPEVRPTSPPQ
jgi:prevent-host-death family protein